jgi:hypothetical protein
MLTLLNTSILTEYGDFSYSGITLETAKQLVWDAIQENGFQSAIGHEATAHICSSLLKVAIPVNRIEYHQNIGDTALIFKLNGRPAEGKILSRDEIEAIGYEWGIITRYPNGTLQ